MVVIEPVVALLTFDSRAIGVALLPVKGRPYVRELVPPLDGPVDTGALRRSPGEPTPYAPAASTRAVGLAVVRVEAVGVKGATASEPAVGAATARPRPIPALPSPAIEAAADEARPSFPTLLASRFRVKEVGASEPALPASHEEPVIAVESAAVVVPTLLRLPAPVVPSATRLVPIKALTDAVRAAETVEAPAIRQIPAAEGAVAPRTDAAEATAEAGAAPPGAGAEEPSAFGPSPPTPSFLPPEVLVGAARRAPVIPEARGAAREAVVTGEEPGVPS